MRGCAISGCDRSHDSHGLCKDHARRFREYGSPTARRALDAPAKRSQGALHGPHPPCRYIDCAGFSRSFRDGLCQRCHDIVGGRYQFKVVPVECIVCATPMPGNRRALFCGANCASAHRYRRDPSRSYGPHPTHCTGCCADLNGVNDVVRGHTKKFCNGCLQARRNERGKGRDYSSRPPRHLSFTCPCGETVTRTAASVYRSRREGRRQQCDDCMRWPDLNGQASAWPYDGDPVAATPLQWCPECGDTPVSGRRRFCSRNCWELSRRPATAVVFGDCVGCGAGFCRTNKDARYCGSECAVRAARRRNRARDRIAGKRRGRRPGLSEVESFTLWEIAERDGWRCHLCGKKVPKRKYAARDKDATIDHLIPLADGGQHTRRNVALAHNRCNWERADKGTAQLRLT